MKFSIFSISEHNEDSEITLGTASVLVKPENTIEDANTPRLISKNTSNKQNAACCNSILEINEENEDKK